MILPVHKVPTSLTDLTQDGGFASGVFELLYEFNVCMVDHVGLQHIVKCIPQSPRAEQTLRLSGTLVPHAVHCCA